jgi:hypothetical protein
VAGVLQRLLTRSGILPVLRARWREDLVAASDKLEKRIDKRFDALTRDIERLRNELSERSPGGRDAATNAPADIADRLSRLDRDFRMLRDTMALDIADRRRGTDRGALFQMSAVADHVQRAIARAPIETDPSVHIVINDQLPADSYQALLEGIPPAVFFSQKDNTKQNLRLSSIHVAPARTIETLSFLEETLIPRIMVPALMGKFAPHIREFYIREYGEERGPALAAIRHEATAGRLMLRRPGYHLDPHLDPKRVVFTCLLYFARPGDSEMFGTTFYRINGTPTIDRTNTFYPGSQGLTCDLVKMVLFKANSAVAFLNWGGAHGADIPKTAPADTERFSYQFYVSPDPAALAAIVGETESAVAD